MSPLLLLSPFVFFVLYRNADYADALLTLTMRHPSWIFLFFGGRIVTFAPV